MRSRRRFSGDWIARFRDHAELSAKGTPAFESFVGWQFFHEQLPGLPDAETDEGRELLRRVYP